MDKKQCGECKCEINDLEPLRCGFCEVFLHISQQCCGINARGLKEAFASGKILLICSTCRAELKGRSISSYMAQTIQSQPHTPSSPILTAQFQHLCGVVDALSKKIDHFTAKPKPPAATLSLCDSPTWPRLSVKRRRDERQPLTLAAPECGTKEINLSDLSVPSILPAAAPKKFWLYLSGINPLATNSDVQKIVCRCLDVAESSEVIRLVPKDKDVTKLSFVSYKVGLDPALKTLALDPSSWPAGLFFREFIDHSKNANRLTIMDQIA